MLKSLAGIFVIDVQKLQCCIIKILFLKYVYVYQILSRSLVLWKTISLCNAIMILHGGRCGFQGQEFAWMVSCECLLVDITLYLHTNK